MKSISILAAAILAAASLAQCEKKEQVTVSPLEAWDDFYPGDVRFTDRSPETRGAQIWHEIVPNPEQYIQGCAREVLHTLYFTPADTVVPHLREIRYRLEEYNGISEKWGGGDHVGIRYSTRWVERCFGEDGDTARVDHETRGVLYHELTHAYQLEPRGCGTYSDGGEYWAFIEGMADAVRLACGGFEQDFQSSDRPRRGHWTKGYRHAGYFLYWLDQNKGDEFLRRFHRSAAELPVWSWDAAMHHVLGPDESCGVEALWKEYQIAVGDIQPDDEASTPNS